MGRRLELLYLDDPVELFFMQIQGSGRVRFPDGSWTRLGYAAKNGHSYTSIGRLLAERVARSRLEVSRWKGSRAGFAPIRSAAGRSCTRTSPICVLP